MQSSDRNIDNAFISSYSTDYFVDDKFNAANTIGSFTLYMSSESFDVEWWNKKYLNELSLLFKCILLNDLLLIKMNLVVWFPASSDVRNLNYYIVQFDHFLQT